MRCPPVSLSDLGAWARAGVHASDMHTALARRDDAGLLALFRAPDAALPDMAEPKVRLDALPLPSGQARRAKRLLRAIERDLEALKNGVPFGRRLLPWAAAMVAVSLPLPIPFHTGQRKFSSLQVAARTKDVMLLLGLIAQDTSTPRAFGRHVENRVFLDLAGTAVYAGPAFIPAARHLMSDLRFNIPATVGIAAATLLYFNRAHLPGMVRGLRERLGIPARTPLSDAARQEIRAWASELTSQKNRLDTLVGEFRQGTQAGLSDNLNRLLNQLEGSFTQLGRELVACAPDPHAQAAPSKPNEDVYPKLSVALFSLMIACSLGAFLHQEISALVDLCARGVWIFSELAKAAADASVNLQGILQSFKEISGLALLLLGYLAANQGLGFLHSDAKSFWIGTAALSAANITLPGPVATVVSKALGKALQTCHRSPAAAAPDPEEARAQAGAVDTITPPPTPRPT